ncbi:hypothetical protein BO71DRAFT_459126 [Aspergillus ellipticus CBS 707.79]|uniref:Uncharacterized protein n=1 Tax=Aspergillus ellipticus CBS 707.79 TaxID=1448320 RepID=A0A319ELB9_9EURO|nr:hypothetical protein BO71DRAFT_459126 [Aspergillus ellipticus CBS 707.79]
MEEEIRQLLNEHGGATDILVRTYAATCIVNGKDPDFREQPGDDHLNFRAYGIANALFLLPYIALASFSPLVDKSNLLPYKERSRRQTARLPESKTGPKGIQPVAEVSRMFFNRYSLGSGQTGFSKPDLEKILAAAAWGSDEDEHEGIISMERTLPSATNKGKMPSEALEFTFDYLALHRNCWRLFRQVREACDPHLRKMHGPEYLEEENQLPVVVGYIVMAAVGVDNLGRALARKDEVVKSRTMVCAAEVVESMLGTPLGSLAVQILATQGYVIEFEVEE